MTTYSAVAWWVNEIAQRPLICEKFINQALLADWLLNRDSKMFQALQLNVKLTYDLLKLIAIDTWYLLGGTCECEMM